jgi:hypothetical protein
MWCLRLDFPDDDTFIAGESSEVPTGSFEDDCGEIVLGRKCISKCKFLLVPEDDLTLFKEDDELGCL